MQIPRKVFTTEYIQEKKKADIQITGARKEFKKWGKEWKIYNFTHVLWNL